MNKAELKDVAIADITIKPQVRTIFDEEPLVQLTASVKEHGVIQAIVLNNIAGKLILVCGERRLRASKANKFTTIPASIYKDLTADQVVQMQIIENLQRKDVHPMEEAIAFKQLMTANKFDALEMSKRISRSIAYVASRLKMNDLIPEFQKVFYANRMTMTTAHEVCKLSADAQKQIFASKKGYEIITIDQHTLNQYKKDLKKAPFDIKDADLVKAVGPCSICPQNTASGMGLFPDEKGESLCMDRKCFVNKCQVSFNLRLKEAMEDPRVVFLSSNYGTGGEVSQQMKKKGHKVYDRYEGVTIVGNPPQKDIESGKVWKGFYVEGDAMGHTVFIKPIKKQASSSSSDAPAKGSAGAFKEKQSAGKATAADINSEINRMNSVEKRKKELDEEKLWPLIHALFGQKPHTPKASEKFKQNSAKLSFYENISVILCLVEELHMGSKDDQIFKSLGFKGSTLYASTDLLKWLSENKKHHEAITNNLMRLYLYSKTNHSGQYSKNAKKLALKNVISEYDKAGVDALVKESNDAISKRENRLKTAIADLKNKMPKAAVKVVSKKKK